MSSYLLEGDLNVDSMKIERLSKDKISADGFSPLQSIEKEERHLNTYLKYVCQAHIKVSKKALKNNPESILADVILFRNMSAFEASRNVQIHSQT